MAYQVYSMLNMFYLFFAIIFLGLLVAGTACSIIFPIISIKSTSKVPFVLGCVANGFCVLADIAITGVCMGTIGNGGVLDGAGIIIILILIPLMLVRWSVFVITTILRAKHRKLGGDIQK